MRILHFCNYAEVIGGAEVYAHGLVESLRSRGHDVALFGASPEGEIDRAGLRVIQRPLYDRDRLVQDPAALAALRDYLQRFAPDVVHVHNVFSVALGVLQHLGTQGIPLLQTVHDFQLLCPNSWCVRGDGQPCPGGAGAQCFQHGCQSNYPYDAWGVLLSSLRQRWLSTCTGIAVAPSAYLVERLRAHGWSDVRHLPYFIDFPPPSRPVPRSSHELLYVGRIEPEKGVPVLLRALPEISASLPEVRLTVVGGGSQLSELRALADRLGIAARLRTLQKIPRTEIAEHYARAALCILPSLWTENSPLVAYECLTSGLPMAGSRLGGIPELLEGGCGITFHPGDPRDLARVVIDHLRLPLAQRERMSAACRERARAFEREHHVDAVVQLYEELRHRPTPATRTPPELSPDGLAMLHQVGLQQAPGDGRSQAPLEVLRAIARSLGLPKVLR
ncbi:MAG TPA: glycosyltransferase [Planctomycetota bacterium]